MRKIVLFLAMVATLLGFCPQVIAKDITYGRALVSEVVSIYDGDTFTVNIKSWPRIVGERISVRIAHIDTPEMKGACAAEISKAREAKQFVVTQLRSAKKIVLRNMRRDKYFRILADVVVDRQLLATKLIQLGLARPYEGGHKTSWCP